MAGLLATISFASCGGDPAGNDPPAPPTETEKYAAWIDRWSDDADAWSRAYFRVVDEVSDENDGSLSIDKVHRAGVTLADAVVALQAGLDQAGRLESKAAAPTYPQALASVSERVLADANAVASCAGPACSARFTSLFTSAPVLERLVVRTSGKLREPSPATREVPLAGRDPGCRRCRRDRARRPGRSIRLRLRARLRGRGRPGSLPEPETAEKSSFATKGRVPTFHALKQWSRPLDATRYFETLDVRSIACTLERKQDGVTWSDEFGPDEPVRTLAWRSVAPTDRGRLNRAHRRGAGR